MKAVIYYFTGTGNTLAAARALAEELGNTRLIPLRRAIHYGGIAPEADAVGIAFPVYFMNMPPVVRQFVFGILFQKDPFVFGLATCGGQPGGALFRLSELLGEKGYALSAGYALVMPENFIGPVSLMDDVSVQEGKIADVRRRIPEIADAIRGRKVTKPEGSASSLQKFGGELGRALMTGMYNIPAHLRATAACNRCGTCARICPVRNITVEKGGVRWGGDCTWCYACIHWCPQQAVEIGGRTKGIPRYHHPDVSLDDMLAQRGE
ncbi:MAG: EFR1 family ferrodoxin [Methanoregula sp.]|nr:EFR1 family ferrodoxin [Methanoregula sp.]